MSTGKYPVVEYLLDNDRGADRAEDDPERDNKDANRLLQRVKRRGGVEVLEEVTSENNFTDDDDFPACSFRKWRTARLPFDANWRNWHRRPDTTDAAQQRGQRIQRKGSPNRGKPVESSGA